MEKRVASQRVPPRFNIFPPPIAGGLFFPPPLRMAFFGGRLLSDQQRMQSFCRDVPWFLQVIPIFCLAYAPLPEEIAVWTKATRPILSSTRRLRFRPIPGFPLYSPPPGQEIPNPGLPDLLRVYPLFCMGETIAPIFLKGGRHMMRSSTLCVFLASTHPHPPATFAAHKIIAVPSLKWVSLRESLKDYAVGCYSPGEQHSFAHEPVGVILRAAYFVFSSLDKSVGDRPPFRPSFSPY